MYFFSWFNLEYNVQYFQFTDIENILRILIFTHNFKHTASILNTI